MNIFFDGTLEESSERQVRETTPDVIEKSSSIAKPIPEKYEKDIEALRKKYGENFKTGLCIEITLKELLEICPRERRRTDAYTVFKSIQFPFDESKVSGLNLYVVTTMELYGTL